MTIIKRLGVGYSIVGALYGILVVCLWHHEFVEEPPEFALHGVTDAHNVTSPEFFSISFLTILPLLLALAWLWTRRVLRPLAHLTHAAEHVQSNNLHLPMPRSQNGDEVDKMAAVFDSMTARLDASFRQIREFTLHASHELKTPLTVMRAELETALQEDKSLPSETVQWMESLLDEVQRLAKIVDSLTLLTKADAGLVNLESQPVAFDELVHEAFEDAVVMAQSQNVKVYLDNCVDTLLTGDRHRLRQLLLILLDNAVKYNRPRGEIHISLIHRQNMAELRITNDGGVIRGDPSRLFNRFVRGENAAAKAEGCGLGLSIAHWIVQATAGTIELTSETRERITALVRFPLVRIPLV
jgi:signal transduction histidine kinase